MQMQLPLFPTHSRLINPTTALEERDEMVYYLHAGSVIYCHDKTDLQSYRFISASLVNTGLCKPKELADVLGVSNRNIQRYAKALREKGSSWFFQREEKRGSCYKFSGEIREQAQEYLNNFYSVRDVARLVGISESAMRYHLKKGTIKKR